MASYPLINAPELNDTYSATFILCGSPDSRVTEYIPNTQILYLPYTYEEYVDLLKKLPFSATSKFICYDLADNEQAARAWWGFQTLGFQDVWILNGGLNAWKAANKPVEKGLPQVVILTSEPSHMLLHRKVDRTIALTQNAYLTETILRTNITFNQLLDPDLKFLPKKEVLSFFEDRELKVNKKTRIHCMGDKAGLALAALALVGFKDLTLLFDSNASVPETLGQDVMASRHSLHSNYYSFAETVFQDAPAEEKDLEASRRSLQPKTYYGVGLSEESSPKTNLPRRHREGIQSASSCNSCLII